VATFDEIDRRSFGMMAYSLDGGLCDFFLLNRTLPTSLSDSWSPKDTFEVLHLNDSACECLAATGSLNVDNEKAAGCQRKTDLYSSLIRLWLERIEAGS
jgi:hypothetical protein